METFVRVYGLVELVHRLSLEGLSLGPFEDASIRDSRQWKSLDASLVIFRQLGRASGRFIGHLGGRYQWDSFFLDGKGTVLQRSRRPL